MDMGDKTISTGVANIGHVPSERKREDKYKQTWTTKNKGCIDLSANKVAFHQGQSPIIKC